MDKSQLMDIARAITEAGLAGRPESALVAELCNRAVAAGMPLARATVIVDTLHPIYEGRVFRWARDTREATVTEYGRSTRARRSSAGAAAPSTGCSRAASRSSTGG
jgi:adenylate cyclase